MEKRTSGGIVILITGGILFFTGFNAIMMGISSYLALDVISSQHFIFGSIYCVTACLSIIGGILIFSDRKTGEKVALVGAIGSLVGGIIWDIIILIGMIAFPNPPAFVIFQNILMIVSGLCLQVLLLFGAILCYMNPWYIEDETALSV